MSRCELRQVRRDLEGGRRADAGQREVVLAERGDARAAREGRGEVLEADVAGRDGFDGHALDGTHHRRDAEALGGLVAGREQQSCIGAARPASRDAGADLKIRLDGDRKQFSKKDVRRLMEGAWEISDPSRRMIGDAAAFLAKP